MKAYNLETPIIPIGKVLNSSFVSSYVQLRYVYAYAIQIVFVGTPSGSFSLQVSSDPVAGANAQGTLPSTQNVPTNWSPLSNSSFNVAAAGSVMWNYEAVPGYNWVQVVYTDTSGGASTATITSIQVSCKGL